MEESWENLDPTFTVHCQGMCRGVRAVRGGTIPKYPHDPLTQQEILTAHLTLEPRRRYGINGLLSHKTVYLAHQPRTTLRTNACS